ncbi:MAG: glycosyltransferase [Prolixibacteraceae bacterium]|nr:glycosyltransferase [Prolixibacteraceae bacterium]
MDVIFKLIVISLRYPGKFLRKFSFSKFNVLLRALRNEPSDQIVSNFVYFLKGERIPQKPVKEERQVTLREQFLLERQILLDEFLKRKTKLDFSKSNPELSILMILYNKAELTLACLQSLLDSDYKNFELIIVDNNSTDKTHELLKRISGAKIIENKENIHFLRANNQAYGYARGEYLLFLNNDTTLPSKSLGLAMETIKSVSHCGAVGGKIILPEGWLQEAGSIVWNDGSCLGYGRHEETDLPQYNFMRETDYCSGAFLLTKAELFKEHGGFDPIFEPAYYEETDYCFWLHNSGYKVVYDPKVEIRHFEFGSGISEKAFELHRVNQQKFFQKHHEQLKGQCYPELTETLIPRFAAKARQKKRILYIDDRVPHIDFGSGFPRSNTIVNMIAGMDWQVTIFPLNFPDEDTWDVAYRDINPFVEIAIGYGLSRFDTFIDERKGYFDVIWISRPHNMEAVEKIIEPLEDKLKIIYDAEAIFAEREIRQKQLNGIICTSSYTEAMIRKEVGLAEIAHVVSSVSENDAGHFKKHGFENVVVLGHCLDIKTNTSSFDDREGLLFVGNLDYSESPNADSVIWFVNEIFPLIRKDIPGITFDVVGSAKSEKIQKLKGKGVKILGKVDNLESYYNQNRLFIAPTRYAAGIPFKIHEAAANGLPVVATRLLADQLGWRHDVELWAVEPEAECFAEMIVSVYNHKTRWKNVQKNAFRYIEGEMSVKAYKQKIFNILSGTV